MLLSTMPTAGNLGGESNFEMTKREAPVGGNVPLVQSKRIKRDPRLLAEDENALLA
jgi:hypothetical protein